VLLKELLDEQLMKLKEYWPEVKLSPHLEQLRKTLVKRTGA
jgi:hypothetical protein